MKPTNSKKIYSSAAKTNAKTATRSAQTRRPANKKTIRRVHNLIIVDASASMTFIHNQALQGINSTLKTVRDSQEGNHEQHYYVSLHTFDSSSFRTIYDNAPGYRVPDINDSQYRLGGATPLYDAIGKGITRLLPKVGDDDIVLVTIITDGEENCSKEYNATTIKILIEAMKERGWVFTYIGANQDVVKVSTTISIENSLSWNANARETAEMFERENQYRRRFFEKAKRYTSRDELRKGYFDKN